MAENMTTQQVKRSNDVIPDKRVQTGPAAYHRSSDAARCPAGALMTNETLDEQEILKATGLPAAPVLNSGKLTQAGT